MNRRFLICALAVVLASCGQDDWPAVKDVRISWDKSSFQEMTSAPIAGTDSSEDNLYYPRIKHLSDGSLFMTFENDHYGWDIYCRKSDDGGKTWSDALLVRKSGPAESTVGEDEVVYVNPDFIELSDGRIMMAWQWRFKSGYNDLPNTNNNCGIEIAFSSDKGLSFSEPVEVYRGRCWEPALLQLPSGEIQMFITSSQDLIDRMSAPQTVVIRSFDGGKTWQGKPLCGIDDNEPIARTIDERSTYCGMPTGVCLDDGGIAVPVEVWHGKWLTDCSPVVVRTTAEDNWKPSPDEDIRGCGGPAWPMMKQLNKDFYGYGPYSTKLPGGEMVVLSNGNYKGREGIWTFVGDRTGENFTNPTTPFDGYWGSVDYIGNGKVVATGTVKYSDGTGTRGKVRICTARLNTAKVISRRDISVVNPSEFEPDSSSFWFLGHSFPSCVYADFAYTKDNFIIASYLYDSSLTALSQENADAVELLVSRRRGPQYRIVVNGRGAFSVFEDNANSWKKVYEGNADDLKLEGTLDKDDDTDLGYSVKVSVPWDVLGGRPSAGEVVKAHLRHHYKKSTSQKPVWQTEGFEGENSDYPEEWLSVKLN